MTITELSTYLDRLDNTSSRIAMTEILAMLFKKASPDEIAYLCYLSLGRLAPKYKGIEFQLSKKSMIKIIARTYKISQEEVSKHFAQKGDIGLVAEQYASKKKGKDSYKMLSVSSLYLRLLEVAEEEGAGSVERKIAGFSSILSGLDPLSARYVTRIPIGALRLGFSDMTLLDALSWMKKGDKSLRKILEHAYNVSADIGFIARIFKEKGEKGIKHLSAQAGIPIRPQKAERLINAQEMIEKVKKAAVEWKFDGFRAQVHVVPHNFEREKKRTRQLLLDEKKYLRVKIFSRSLEDTTYMFPEIQEAFSRLPITSAIFDGEAIGYDPKTGKHLLFQETIQRKRKHGIERLKQKIPLRYYVFDVLFINGKTLLSEPFYKRRKILEKFFAENKKKIDQDTICLTPQTVTENQKDIERLFHTSIQLGYEGIMVKKYDAVYQAGARDFTWIKFKHHGEGKLSDTLDCVVMGYYHGQGKRTSFGIGAFLVGVRGKDENMMLTVAKIGTGLSDNQWKILRKKCAKLKTDKRPSSYKVPKELIPPVWVKPGVVVEIAADEITRSPLHTAGLALRFPRLVRFRDDKLPQDATSIQEVQKIYKMQSG